MIKRGYRKPVRTGKPNPITAVRPGSIDDLMTKFNATIRRAKKETATTSMLFEATVQINDMHEYAMFREFLLDLKSYRGDAFAITPEVKEKTEAAMRFDELVPADAPPEATAGPTWANMMTVLDDQGKLVIVDEHPTEDDAVAAFKKFAGTHKAEESVALVKSFNVARVKELKPEQRASFIAEAARDS